MLPSPITRKSRVSGALVQERGQRPSMYSLFRHRYLHSSHQEAPHWHTLPPIHLHHSDLNLETGPAGPSPSLPLDPQCTLYFPVVEFITLAFQMSTSSPRGCKLNRVGDQACVLHQRLSGPSTEPGIQSEVGGGGESEKKSKKRETPTKEHQQRSEDKQGGRGGERNSWLISWLREWT